MSRILNKCKNINKFSKNMTLRQQLVRAMIKIRYNAKLRLQTTPLSKRDYLLISKYRSDKNE